jgi:hypothetical protein
VPTQRTFGQRALQQSSASQAKPPPSIEPPEANVEPSTAALTRIPVEGPSVEDELHEWKRWRKKGFQIPWRQLFVMAGLCFAIASFVLPDSVSDDLQWLLYALAAASFYAGFRKRKNA